LIMQRDSILERLRSGDEVFDILVIGGGASGLGAAVDAAVRGYRVALVEQADFAKGTSSRSTKLVHGGVRYLKQGDISLVRSAMRERGLLRRNAPHLVQAMPFVIPAYTWWERPYYGLGMAMYDRLAGSLSFGRSQRLNRAETIDRLPTVETKDLAGGVLYHDGQFDDARLAITLARTALAHGALLANYCACIGLVKENGRVGGVLVRDIETGNEFSIRSRAVINATGVFVDAVRRFDDPAASPLVAVSQGVHLVLPREFLPGTHALMVPRTADGRVLFAIPWHDRVVVGTTDTPGVVPALEPRAQAAELAFILEHARRYLVRDPADRDVLSVFTGLRPLVNRGKSGNTATLSRDHTIAVSASNLITLTGGKWTTYRKMAEDVIDQTERVAGFRHRPCPTATMPLHGADASEPPAPHLRVYGADAAGIVALAREDSTLAAPLDPAFSVSRAEVVWHVRHEMARTVEDVLARRTRALVLDARASIAAAPAVARILAKELGRDDRWAANQVRQYAELAGGWMLPSAQGGAYEPTRSAGTATVFAGPGAASRHS
jgi:glycerol-3-phosphate dehydrogenase